MWEQLAHQYDPGMKQAVPEDLLHHSHHHHQQRPLPHQQQQHHHHHHHQQPQPQHHHQPHQRQHRLSGSVIDHSHGHGHKHKHHRSNTTRRHRRVSGMDNPIYYGGGGGGGGGGPEEALLGPRGAAAAGGGAQYLGPMETIQIHGAGDVVRGTASLESLSGADSVSSSIQQARANSIGNSGGGRSKPPEEMVGYPTGEYGAGGGGAGTDTDQSEGHYPLGGSQSQQPHQYGGGGGVFDHHHHHRQPQHHQHQHHQHQHHQHLSLPRVGYPLRKSSSRGSDNSIGNAADLILGTGMPIGDVISSRRSSEGGDLVFRTAVPRSRYYSNPDLGPEVARLKRELKDEQEKNRITSSFEQSLASLSEKMAKLSEESEKKDRELIEMKKEIEELKKVRVPPIVPRRTSGNTDEASPAAPPAGATGASSSGAPTTTTTTGSRPSITSNNSNTSFQQMMNGTQSLQRNKAIGKKLRTSIRHAASKINKASLSATNLIDQSLYGGSSGHRRSGGTQRKSGGDKKKASVERGTSKESSHGDSGKNKVRKSKNGSPTGLARQETEKESSSNKDAPSVSELQKEVRAKEELLTEARLEALSAASQIETLKENLASVKQELKSIKVENEELRLQTKRSNSRGQTSRQHSLDDSKAKSTLVVDFGRWSKRGREDIIVDLATDGTKIGLIRLPAANPGSSMSLRELDQGVERLVSLYLSRIDPTGVLGLTWEGERPLEGVYRFRGLARRIFTGKEADDGAGGGQLDLDDSGDKQISVTFNQLLSGFAIKTLRPLTEVERYVNILLQERLVLMSGHSGFGLPQGLLSSALCLCLFGGNDGENGAYASRFVKSIACRQWRSKSEDSIAREVFSERHASFKAFLLEEASATQMRPILERLSEVVDRNVLILATNSSEDPVQVRVTQIRLPRDYDPHLLGLHLRKRLVTQEVANNAANNEMMSALGWLCGVFRAVSKHNAPSLMPVFLGCPLENTHKFRTWFIDTWNSDVVAELRRYGLKADSGGEDPVRFVIRSWPWKEDVAGLPQALASVIPRQRLRRTSTTRRTRPEGAEDPLLSMLLHLQQAAGNNGSGNNGGNGDQDSTDIY